MAQFKNQGFKVIYDGHEYEMGMALAKAKLFILKYYKNENVESWVNAHLYRSHSTGEVIYLKYPGGESRPLRDFFVEQWQAFELQKGLSPS
jgi:hypothetical protein